jgi:outer membrane protein OmpA-like peptidoglycan-associated protein
MARWIWFAGFTAFLVIGYFATFYEHGKAQWRSVRFVEGELQAGANDVLKRVSATWARVQVDGQIATLTGVAPSEADRDDLESAVRAAVGPGGPWLGGITQVRDEMTVAKPVAPYTWSAVRTADGGVKLSGYVPGRRHRHAIGAEARKLFPKGVEDETVIAAGHATGPWADTAIWSLQQLSKLQSGEARFVDALIVVRGQARNADVQSAIYMSAKALKRPYEGVAEVTLAAAGTLPPAPTEPAPPPVEPPAPRLGAADCQKLIDEAMSNNIIEFASGSAKLKASSHGLLDRMAQTAADCGGLRLRLTGHTDGTSLELAKDELSQQRADAAANYLAAKGLARERLITEGAGSSEPVAENSTVAGQARNRRVEITVLP